MTEPTVTKPPNLKLLLIGNSSVGKSSLLLRFTDDDFLNEDETTATIGVDFRVKSIESEGVKYKLSIWDTAGQERFRTLTSSYYRGAQGVILVYDVSSRATFEELSRWFHELDSYTNPEIARMIVGNKVDKEFSRQVTTAEGKAFADRMNCQFIECSAKTRQGVKTAFATLVAQIVSTPSLFAKDSSVSLTESKPNQTITLEETPDADAQGGWGLGGGCSC
ncbi:ras-domain-containing protein [Phaffia rhodozyma]|uniref:Ras-domain-containing protein n=1 Tax=Phaffia rhodozyma TaxID=264483 RepID=A0A0F7SW24_PHARH|nr:ras-domain-containing protein [Phaffia rhodozyma]